MRAAEPQVAYVYWEVAHQVNGPLPKYNMLSQHVLPVFQPFREAKICEFQMSVFIQKQILWLKVSVHNLMRMQVIQGTHNFTGVEICRQVIEASSIAQVRKQFATTDEFQQHVEETLIVMTPQPVENEQNKG